MENRSHALMAGFFTIGLLIATIAIAVWFGRDKIQRTPYEIATRMSVSGLNLQAAVRYKGIKVGNVTAINFDPKDPGLIVVRMEVVDDTPVTRSTFATLAYQGVTGIAYVMLDDDGSQPAPLMLSGEHLPRIPLRPGLFQSLEQRGTALLTQAEELAKRLNGLLDANNPQSVPAAIDSIHQAATAWQGVPAKLDPVLNKLPQLGDQAGQTLHSVQALADDANKLTRSLNALSVSVQAKNGTLDKLNTSIDQLSTSFAFDTLPRLNTLSGDARSTLRQVNRTVEQIGSRPQSILFGNPAPAPGPGEPGFSSSGK
jgi:phospholipid/cholesterol/gamma-HCH transport system substrate-binding protein